MTEVDANDHTQGGALVFAGTRLPVSCIINYIRAGSDNTTIRAAYPDVTDDQIEGCRRLIVPDHLQAVIEWLEHRGLSVSNLTDPGAFTDQLSWWERALSQQPSPEPEPVAWPEVVWWNGAAGPAERLAESLETYAGHKPGGNRDIWAMRAAAKWIRQVLALPSNPKE